jgi:hypothetical protein
VKILGTPLIPKWGSQGNWTEGSTTGTADIVIPVNGPKGKGRLAVKAEKKSGVWKINSLILVHESKWMQIEPSIPNSTCQ